jgi:ribonuclease III
MNLEALQAKLAHTFEDPGLLRRALTHASHANESGEPHDNQRMEFLGDSVLNLAISTELFALYGDWPEGKLSRLRSQLVCEATLARMATDLGLGQQLRLGRGENTSGGREKPSLLADAYEAVLAAIYLDGGFPAAQRFILDAFAAEIDAESARQNAADFKTRLQELVQATSDLRPRYSIIATDGPPHAREFTAEVRVGEDVLGVGLGMSKKAAQQEAARGALETLATRLT